MRTAAQEALERVFNTLWREDRTARRRLSRVCGAGLSCAVITLPGGVELLAPVRALVPLGRLRTAFPYYLRRPDAPCPEEVDSASQLLELLADETGTALPGRWTTILSESTAMTEPGG